MEDAPLLDLEIARKVVERAPLGFSREDLIDGKYLAIDKTPKIAHVGLFDHHDTLIHGYHIAADGQYVGPFYRD